MDDVKDGRLEPEEFRDRFKAEMLRIIPWDPPGLDISAYADGVWLAYFEDVDGHFSGDSAEECARLDISEAIALGKGRVADTLTAENLKLREALTVAATAEMYDPATGIIDADVLEIVQDTARTALSSIPESA